LLDFPIFGEVLQEIPMKGEVIGKCDMQQNYTYLVFNTFKAHLMKSEEFGICDVQQNIFLILLHVAFSGILAFDNPSFVPTS
jgi:hypothetical protein